MERPIDFSKLSLEELTPIVSMRPGKEYTREELKEARAAFMAALNNDDTANSVLTETPEPETASSPAADSNAVINENESTEAAEEPVCRENAPSECTEASSAVPEETTPSAEEENIESASLPEEPLLTEVTVNETETPTETDDFEETFILKAESRLARFLYILYAYCLLPLLALESLLFLVGSVVMAIMVRDVPFIFIHIFAAGLYTIIVSVSWHQFMYRTELGLLLNRSLIGVCIFRGFSMILSGTALLIGIIYIALSLLYLVFFVAYDSTFVIPSQD